MRFTIAFAMMLLATPLAGQTRPDPPLKGVLAPDQVRAHAIRTSTMVDLVNSVKVLADTDVGRPMVELRVVSVWGGPSMQPCDCLTTVVYLGINVAEGMQYAFALPELLEPVLDSVRTESTHPVVYITYGDVGARHQIRAEVIDSMVHVSPGGGHH